MPRHAGQSSFPGKWRVRIATWLHRLAARVSSGSVPPPFPREEAGMPESGPPAHWVAMLRERAPHLLEPGAMQGGSAPPRRPSPNQGVSPPPPPASGAPGFFVSPAPAKQESPGGVEEGNIIASTPSRQGGAVFEAPFQKGRKAPPPSFLDWWPRLKTAAPLVMRPWEAARKAAGPVADPDRAEALPRQAPREAMSGSVPSPVRRVSGENPLRFLETPAREAAGPAAPASQKRAVPQGSRTPVEAAFRQASWPSVSVPRPPPAAPPAPVKSPPAGSPEPEVPPPRGGAISAVGHGRVASATEEAPSRAGRPEAWPPEPLRQAAGDVRFGEEDLMPPWMTGTWPSLPADEQEPGFSSMEPAGVRQRHPVLPAKGLEGGRADDRARRDGHERRLLNEQRGRTWSGQPF